LCNENITPPPTDWPLIISPFVIDRCNPPHDVTDSRRPTIKEYV
jgi:hypothetical protein